MSEESGEDAPPRPKRKIKKVMVLSSSSSSDSEESVAAVVTRKKRLRVVSDVEGSDSSSGSSVGARRRRKLPMLRDSDVESDWSGWASPPHASTSVRASGAASDSSEGNSDKCSICLLRFTDQQIGTPENCEHIFCLDCITEWSRNVNTCPVDRATFNTIVVRACIGGRVLRTEPVTVVERPPSVDLLVMEDPTPCEICRSTSNEEIMLLCDRCDLGYHMECLDPPLYEIPENQWYCPTCINSVGITYTDGMSIIELMPAYSSEEMILRMEEMIREHTQRSMNIPSTSSEGERQTSQSNETPTTSRGSHSSQRNHSSTSAVRRRGTGSQRRKPRRRKTRTVVIEYEIEENGKFPITKRVKRKIKRRKTKRKPRTVARRTHVRASVRAKLARQRASTTHTGHAGHAGHSALTAVTLPPSRRRAAPLPAHTLSLYGDPNQLDYFSDDENDVSEGATSVVAARPTSSILNAYRQARRKLVTIPSPPHATSAPDILSNILESQTLLHSKNSIVSISVNGDVNIKLQNNKANRPKTSENQTNNKKDIDMKVDLSKPEDAARKVPSYPGQSRGGGWGGGYRGNYHREQTSNNFNRGGNYENNYGAGSTGNGGGGFQGRPGQSNPYPYQNNNMRREEPESFGNYTRRPNQYSHNEEIYDRSRRPPSVDTNRGPNYPNPNHQRLNDPNQGRFSLGPTWQPYASTATDARADGPPLQARHSFGGFENPLDMRMGQPPSIIPNTNTMDIFAGVQAPRQDKTQPQSYQPLPEPPSFNFEKLGDVDKSEDERSDSGLVIDTEKYDPTEPTNDDDDSGDDEKTGAVPRAAVPSPALPQPALPRGSPPSAPTAPPPPAPLSAPHLSPPYSAVQSILAGIDTTAINVSPNVLDSAVRQVLQEHRNLIVPTSADVRPDRSDEDSDGDCPNFSIYSATSVHIANNTANLTEEISKPLPEDNLEDLVQEDDETPPPEAASPSDLSSVDSSQIYEEKKESISSKTLSDVKKKTEEEYKEKVSKRCPITTNTRNPIKIKLHTSSLMKKSVSLYDEDDEDDEVNEDNDAFDKSEPAVVEPEDVKTSQRTPSPIKESENVTDTEQKMDCSEQEDEHKPREAADKDLIGIYDSSDDKNVKHTCASEEQEMSINKIFEDAPEKQIVCEVKGRKEPTEDAEVSDINIIRKSENDELASETDEKLENEEQSDGETDDISVNELNIQSPKRDDEDKDNVEKMTESISETEDERSYTPCLDENKSKDTSFDTEKERGIEGLDTEMISEEEGNEMFSENERPPSPKSRVSPPRPADDEEGEIVDRKIKEDVKKTSARDEVKKKKKKDSKKDGKDKSKNKKKGDVAFKKLSKNGKERNYREREKEEKKNKKDRRDSDETAEERQRRRREKRKDLERYDVRTVVTEKRKKMKDPFGRDISPRAHSPSLSRSPPPPSPAPHSRSGTPTPIRRSSLPRQRLSPSPPPRRTRLESSQRSATPHVSPRRSPSPKRRSALRKRRRDSSPRRRRSTSRARKRRRSTDRSPKPKVTKKKKRSRSERPPSRRRIHKSPKRRRRRTVTRSPPPSPPPRAWTPPSVDSRLLSPRTPPPEPSPEPRRPRLALPEDERPKRKERRRRDPERRKRPRDVGGPSKEVFTSGDNILVSVSFKEQERVEDGERRKRRDGKRERRRRRRADAETDAAKPVAIIDLERSPFRELTPSPKNVIVLSDSDRGDEPDKEPTPAPVAVEPTPESHPHPHTGGGPKTPPSPAIAPHASPPPEEPRATAATEPRSPDAYDPFEPTRSASASPGSPTPAPSPPRALMTLETAQKTNMSADEVLDRRPLSPMEKVLALLQSTRDVSPEPPPGEPPEAPIPAATAPAPAPTPAPAPRIVLPEPARAAPKLFPGKPSPIKSNPVKPMQQTATKIARAAPLTLETDSPYSPGSSDFGDLFEPPPGAPKPATKLQSVFDALFDKPPRARKGKSSAAKVPVKLNKKKGKTQVGVKIDEDNLKILDDLPSSAVEMQVKSKFLKKLNRQERVVEEVKLVLKPHYNKKHVTKEEYKDILRRAVPKICHNKTGEINPTKIQALVEAYVKKFRKKHKLGLA